MTEPTPLDHLEAQLEVEEGKRWVIYDDATGKPLKRGDTIKGNVSVGVGLNLMIPFDAAELKFMQDNRIGKAMRTLAKYDWFAAQDPVRQVALADLAYNLGPEGLLHWVHFLSAMGNKDYPAAVAQIKSNALWIAQVHPARANRIETMISTGAWPQDVPLV